MRENFTHMREDHAQLAPLITINLRFAPTDGRFAPWHGVGYIARLRDSTPDRAGLHGRSRMTYPGAAGRVSALAPPLTKGEPLMSRAERVERPLVRQRRDWTVCKASQVASMRRDAPRRALGSKEGQGYPRAVHPFDVP